MEEMVWIYVGVIAIIITIASIGSFLYKKTIEDSETVMENTVTALSQFCNKVCQMPLYTRQSVKVKFVTNTLMEKVIDDLIITTPERKYAVHCDCNILSFDILNLTNAPFFSHEYNCFFERNITGLNVECLG